MSNPRIETVYIAEGITPSNMISLVDEIKRYRKNAEDGVLKHPEHLIVNVPVVPGKVTKVTETDSQEMTFIDFIREVVFSATQSQSDNGQ